MSELPSLLLCADNIYAGKGLEDMDELCYLLDANSDGDCDSDTEDLPATETQPEPAAENQQEPAIGVEPSTTPMKPTRPNPFEAYKRLLDPSEEHLWLQPPHALAETSAHFRYSQLDEGLYAIRHNASPEEVYVIPVQTRDDPAPYDAPKIVEPGVEFSLEYKEYQRLREFYLMPTGGSSHRRGSGSTLRGNNQEPPYPNEDISLTPVPESRPVKVAGPQLPPTVTDSRRWNNRTIGSLRSVVDPFKYYNTSISNETMAKRIRENPVFLVSVPETGFWVLPVPPHLSYQWIKKSLPEHLRSLDQWGPKFFVWRSPEKTFGIPTLLCLEALMKQTLEGDYVTHSSITAFMKNTGIRGAYKAKHVGIINHYGGSGTGSNGLRLTKDTTNQPKADQTDAIKRLFVAIHGKIATVLNDHLRSLDPDVYAFGLCIRQRVLSLKYQELHEWALDNGPAFFCVALTQGSSDYLHIDRTDNPKSYAFVVPFGKFEGGEAVLPSFGLTIPLQPGQYLAFNAAYIPHYCATLTGVRYVATFFTDRGLAAKTRDILLMMGLKVSQLNFHPHQTLF